MNGSSEYQGNNHIESLNRWSVVNAGMSLYDSPWKSLARRLTFLGIGLQLNIGRLILEVGDNGGDELGAVGGSVGSGLDREDSPGPDVRAYLEDGALRGGLGCKREGE